MDQLISVIHHQMVFIAKEVIKPQPQAMPVITARQANRIAPKAAFVTYTKMKAAPKIATTKRVPIANNTQINSVSTSQNTLMQNVMATNSTNNKSGHERHANASMAVIVICAIFIPPLGVALMYGISDYFWIDLILTLLFWLPGMIFALIVVLS